MLDEKTKELIAIGAAITANCQPCLEYHTVEARKLAGNGVPRPSGREVLETIGAPALLMQGNPRQVVTANQEALDLFGKELRQVEGRRGGEVFDCVHSLTIAGCGKDANCEHCAIKRAIVDTFDTTTPHRAITATLPVRKAGAFEQRALQVSTQKVGEWVVVRVEKYDNPADPAAAA